MLRKWLLAGVWLAALPLVEPFMPFAWALGGSLAWFWVYKSKWVLGLVFAAGIVIDLYWGRVLGLSSLGLMITLGLSMLVHEHFTQWWVLAVIAALSGLFWSWWFYGMVSVVPIIGCVLAALGWYSVDWYLAGRHRGVYLKR